MYAEASVKIFYKGEKKILQRISWAGSSFFNFGCGLKVKVRDFRYRPLSCSHILVMYPVSNNSNRY